jgi:hypothetical protein
MLTRCTPVIPALRMLRQEDCEFKAGLSYTVRSCQKERRRGEGREKRGERDRQTDRQTGVVIHTCNPSYLVSRDWMVTVQDQPTSGSHL